MKTRSFQNVIYIIKIINWNFFKNDLEIILKLLFKILSIYFFLILLYDSNDCHEN